MRVLRLHLQKKGQAQSPGPVSCLSRDTYPRAEIPCQTRPFLFRGLNPCGSWWKRPRLRPQSRDVLWSEDLRVVGQAVGV